MVSEQKEDTRKERQKSELSYRVVSKSRPPDRHITRCRRRTMKKDKRPKKSSKKTFNQQKHTSPLRKTNFVVSPFLLFSSFLLLAELASFLCLPRTLNARCSDVKQRSGEGALVSKHAVGQSVARAAHPLSPCRERLGIFALGLLRSLLCFCSGTIARQSHVILTTGPSPPANLPTTDKVARPLTACAVGSSTDAIRYPILFVGF